MSTYVPRITGFLCNWCSYAGADLAGVSRFPYPPNLRIIRTMCSARIDPEFVIEALQGGADGVMVLGCHFGDCHYNTGNYYTDRRMTLLRYLFDKLGLARQRFDWDWVSAAEGARFAELVSTFTEQLVPLGPPGEAEGFTPDEYQHRLRLALRVMKAEPVRWLLGRQYQMGESGDVFGDETSRAQLEEKLHALVDEALKQESLLLALEAGPGTVPTLAKAAGLKTKYAVRLIAELMDQGVVAHVGDEDDYAVFALI